MLDIRYIHFDSDRVFYDLYASNETVVKLHIYAVYNYSLDYCASKTIPAVKTALEQLSALCFRTESDLQQEYYVDTMDGQRLHIPKDQAILILKELAAELDKEPENVTKRFTKEKKPDYSQVQHYPEPARGLWIPGEAVPKFPEPFPPAVRKWQCKWCSFVNTGCKKTCLNCGSPNPKQWNCPECNHKANTWNYCKTCAAPRPGFEPQTDFIQAVRLDDKRIRFRLERNDDSAMLETVFPNGDTAVYRCPVSSAPSAPIKIAHLGCYGISSTVSGMQSALNKICPLEPEEVADAGEVGEIVYQDGVTRYEEAEALFDILNEMRWELEINSRDRDETEITHNGIPVIMSKSPVLYTDDDAAWKCACGAEYEHGETVCTKCGKAKPEPFLCSECGAKCGGFICLECKKTSVSFPPDGGIPSLKKKHIPPQPSPSAFAQPLRGMFAFGPMMPSQGTASQKTGVQNMMCGAWECTICGTRNTGKFCKECGAPCS